MKASPLAYSWKWSDAVWLALYLLILWGVIWGLFRARSYALADFSTVEAQAEWTAWRESVQQGNSEVLPVKRKIPKSTEPPTLVLLRDYFGVCLLAGIVLSSLFFGSLLLLVRAALHAPAFVPKSD